MVCVGHVPIESMYIILICLPASATPTGAVPTYVWPLGQGILTTEVKTNHVSGTIKSVGFVEGKVGNGLDYDAFLFSGSASNSYVEVEIMDNAALNIDMTFVVLVYFNSITDGTIFHLRSNDQEALDSITDIELSLTAGGLVLNMSGDGDITASAPWENSEETLTVPLSTGQWLLVGLERDLNKDTMTLYVDGALYKTSPIFAKDTPIELPALLRIGGSQNSATNSLDGRVTCLSISPAKFNYLSELDVDTLLNECKTTSWGAAAPLGGCPSSCAGQDATFTLASSGSAPTSPFSAVDSDQDITSRECAVKCKMSSVCMSFVYNKVSRACHLFDGNYVIFTEATDSADRYYIRNDTCCP